MRTSFVMATLMQEQPTTKLIRILYRIMRITWLIGMFECSRISQDSHINDFGKRLLELCTLFDLQLINGCRSWDNHGNFTFISEQGCSVVDYFLMSSSLLDFVHTFSVEDRIESDHMPVELYCNFYADQNAHLGEKLQAKKEKIFWCEEKVQDFKDYVTFVEVRDKLCLGNAD